MCEPRYLSAREIISIVWNSNETSCWIPRHSLPISPCPEGCRDRYGRPGYRFRRNGGGGPCKGKRTCRYAQRYATAALMKIIPTTIKQCVVCNRIFVNGAGKACTNRINDACRSPVCRSLWANEIGDSAPNCAVCGKYAESDVQVSTAVLTSAHWIERMTGGASVPICANGPCRSQYLAEADRTLVGCALRYLRTVTEPIARLKLREELERAVARTAPGRCATCGAPVVAPRSAEILAVAVPMCGICLAEL